MKNKKQVNVEELVKFVEETPKEKLEKLIDEVAPEIMYELCMDNLKEKDYGLKLTGNCKKCYDYAAEQFILNYIDDKSMFDITDSIRSGKFYNTWKGFLCMVKYIVEDGGEFHSSIARNYEDIINHSGISRKTWIKFLDYYFL